MTDSFKGSWDDDIHWQVLATNEAPPKKLVTAVFCVAITKTEEIVLARSKRGWGLLGGHVESGESLEEALQRESIEEGGFAPVQPQLFAVMKITPKHPILRPGSTDEYHPFPISYQLYYWAKSDLPIATPTAIEIIESKVFSLASIKQLKIIDYPLIDLGYKAYQSSI